MSDPSPLGGRGDVNGDGTFDLVTANQFTGTVNVCWQRLSAFGAAQSFAAGSASSSLSVANFNDDSMPDLVTANADSGTISVLLGTGTGSFRPPVTVAGTGAAGMVVGDFNGDGLPDTATANSVSNNVSVLLNDGDWPALDAPVISIGDVTITEGNNGTVTAAFTVSLPAAYNQTVSVHYATADGSATQADGDYEPAAGTVTFAPGMTSQIIIVVVNGDRIGENDESFSVRLSDPSNAFVVDPTGVGSIRDDEPFISISGYASGAEGNTGTTLFTFVVTLSAPYDAPVTVDYSTADLTIDEEYWYGLGATAGDDYTAASGTATIAARELSQTITVAITATESASTLSTSSSTSVTRAARASSPVVRSGPSWTTNPPPASIPRALWRGTRVRAP